MDIEKPNCIGCHHVHPDNGNCAAVGGFCTAVPAAYCPLIPELQAENEKLRAELEQAHEDNKKLCAAMMSIARTDDIARNEIVFRVSYEDALTHDSVRDVAEIFMRKLLREDLKRREIRED